MYLLRHLRSRISGIQPRQTVLQALWLGLLVSGLSASIYRFSPAWAAPARYVAVKTEKSSANAARGADKRIDYATQVQPIFAANCYACHGERKVRGGLRLDSKAPAMKGGLSGAAIVPGDSAKSHLVKRILGQGEEAQMPLGQPPLSDAQIATIRAWIDEGANWPEAVADEPEIEKHWSYIKPVHPASPPVKNARWVVNPIDNFVLARLEKEGLTPQPPADRATLLRRVSLDLIGLPPTIAETDAFLADKSADAYEKVVDRLLKSPHYGERWGRHWLDLARYADTNGYEKDRERTIWPYRDWVIDAINRDMPFDQFAIEQIAGDMLPNATLSQRIATGFHRNTMLNEEGGIDVEEFRQKALVDRVETTSAAFLGVTLQCANCHNHKYDAFSQREYYAFTALLNNADEPVLEIPTPEVTAKRAAIQTQLDQLRTNLEREFPLEEASNEWQVLAPIQATATSGATLQVLADSAIQVAGNSAPTDTYTLRFETSLTKVSALRLEALTDAALPHNGPGRAGEAGNGNFVLSEIEISAAPRNGGEAEKLVLSGAEADFSQQNFGIEKAIDGDLNTGWAIAGDGNFNQNRSAILHFKNTIGFAGGTVFTVTLAQNYPQHTLGKFRISVPDNTPKTPIPTDEAGKASQRAQFLSTKMMQWERELAPKIASWTTLEPIQFARNYGASITKLEDNSLLFSGDNFYRDEYKLEFANTLPSVTALRLEVLPDSTLPRQGPGRNPEGGFLLSEFSVASGEAPIELQSASADVGSNASAAIDGKHDTHWTMPRGDGRAHTIIFRFKTPLTGAKGARLLVSLLQNYHQQENIGRLRISVTDAPNLAASTWSPPGVPAAIESILLTPKAQRDAAQNATLKAYFLDTTPLLSAQHTKTEALRDSMPRYGTTLVMSERSVPRETKIHRRGEFLNLGATVEPGVPAILHPLPKDAPVNRLALARWLVSTENPLVGRVVMNRDWATFFGRGLVNTVQDFGVMGEAPSHPELLDWLATEWMQRGWSSKAMHRLIVTSATYRQSSQVTPELLKRDPFNILLARGPRARVEAEIVRDIALASSGLLSPKIGGPSVFPPQPAGVTDLSYGAMQWNTSTGENRYRRGMYTFLKRTSPYPSLTVFDAPTADASCPRRNKSNTPLQALTTLNNTVFVEAAQAMARRIVAQKSPDVNERIRFAFRLCVTREPNASELAQLTAFYQKQLARFTNGELDASKVALSESALPESAPKPAPEELPQLAAWTTLARVLLNLDETVTKE